MSNLYLYNYNNYFNRIVKKESTLADYGTPIYSITGTNFDMNDSVEASHVVNYGGFDGDYVVITDNENKITSRWFVMENTRNRGGQHTLKLRRDLIVDNYDKIINSPALINKAMLNDKTNPLLFNSEGFNFNQIKKQEILLKDKTNTPWYILYFNKNTPSSTGSFTLGDVDSDITIEVDIDDNSSPFKSGTYSYVDNHFVGINYDPVSQGGLPGIIQFLQFGIPNFASNPKMDAGAISDYIWFDSGNDDVEAKLYDGFKNSYNTLKGYINAEITNTIMSETNFNQVKSYTSLRVLAISSGVQKLYQVNISVLPIERTAYATTGTMYDFITNTITATGLTHTGNWGNKAFPYSYTEYEIRISHSEITTSNTVSWSLNFANQTETIDAPYNVVAIPVYDISVADYSHSYNCLEQNNTMLVNSLIKTLSTHIYDVQILPYFPYIGSCPLMSAPTSVYGVSIELLWGNSASEQYLNSKQYLGFNPDTYNSCIMFFVNSINFTFDITEKISIKSRTSNDAINKKISNELDMYRLVSPNYNGMFEFSVAKNDGVDFFNVDVTLRPYNPYIHINPNFKSMYGVDFNDSRGLICQGDFSIPIITDRFIEYEYQNKNYLQTFNRQVEHMDFEYSKARTEALFGATIGSVGAGLSGGLAGGKIGGGVGAVAGATIGTLTSAIGGAVDYNILKQRQAENKDLMIDNFNYQLGNIKALPYSINKVTAYTFNNKMWPFIEVYSATEQEESILINKIKWTSMTVNTIGYITDYLLTNKNYLSASLIRLEDLDCQMHEAQEIYNEVLKGVFI